MANGPIKEGPRGGKFQLIKGVKRYIHSGVKGIGATFKDFRVKITWIAPEMAAGIRALKNPSDFMGTLIRHEVSFRTGVDINPADNSLSMARTPSLILRGWGPAISRSLYQGVRNKLKIKAPRNAMSVSGFFYWIPEGKTVGETYNASQAGVGGMDLAEYAHGQYMSNLTGVNPYLPEGANINTLKDFAISNLPYDILTLTKRGLRKMGVKYPGWV